MGPGNQWVVPKVAKPRFSLGLRHLAAKNLIFPCIFKHWGPLGPIGAPLGPHWGPLGPIGPHWAPLGPIGAPAGSVRGASGERPGKAPQRAIYKQKVRWGESSNVFFFSRFLNFCYFF